MPTPIEPCVAYGRMTDKDRAIALETMIEGAKLFNMTPRQVADIAADFVAAFEMEATS